MSGQTLTVLVALTSTGFDKNGAKTYTYSPIVQHDDTVTTLTATNDTAAAEVMSSSPVSVPMAEDYEYIHFGLWTALADSSFLVGQNTIASLGIGFVADAAGDSMTTDMPVFGDATYTGNWVAAVKAANLNGTGAISDKTGQATVEAHFVRNTVGVTLAGLATLSGAIDGSEFSGASPASVTASDDSGLDAAGVFTGTMSGAFFGPQGKEVGGVFDYSSLNDVEGAFRGAFGAARVADIDFD